jgi:hypothetical protein
LVQGVWQGDAFFYAEHKCRSSGIQCVAALADKVGRLGVYLRSVGVAHSDRTLSLTARHQPTWIVPPFNIDLAKKKPDGTPDLTYTEEDRERFRNDPECVPF